MHEFVHVYFHECARQIHNSHSWASQASITAVKNSASLANVREVASSQATYGHCLQPSAHPCPLTCPDLYASGTLDMLGPCISGQALTPCLSCNCCISFLTAANPSGLNIFSPFFNDTCGVANRASVEPELIMT